jgi:hypothetical protein
MNPPLSIGDEVIIIGPSKGGSSLRTGQKFRISQSRDGYYSKRDIPWYPASSLRLVEEDLKMGDLVEVVGKSYYLDNSCLGKVFRIDEIRPDALIPAFGRLYFAKFLRKLTSEEITMHTGTIGYQVEEWQKEMEKVENAVRKLLAPDIEKGIHKAVNAFLVENNQKLKERLSAIEKRQESQCHRLNRHTFDINGIKSRLSILEGERPEVCPSCTVPDCDLSDVKIRISITRGGIEHIHYHACPCECGEWAEKVLDSMREG